MSFSTVVNEASLAHAAASAAFSTAKDPAANKLAESNARLAVATTELARQLRREFRNIKP